MTVLKSEISGGGDLKMGEKIELLPSPNIGISGHSRQNAEKSNWQRRNFPISCQAIPPLLTEESSPPILKGS